MTAGLQRRWLTACALALLWGAGVRAEPPVLVPDSSHDDHAHSHSHDGHDHGAVEADADALSLPGRAAGAEMEPRAQGRLEVYADDDRTTVWRPRVSGSVQRAEGFQVGASWMADVVSSASVDVLTRASQSIEETRHEIGASGAWLGPEAGELSVAYAYGFERDHASHALAVGVARDLDDDRLWHGAAALSLARARIGTVIDPRFEEHSHTVGLSFQLSRVIDPRTVLRGGLELAAVLGFQASPYRAVRLGDWTAERYDGDDPDATPWIFTGVTGVLREHHPDRRLRARLVLDGVRALLERAALHGMVSAYLDDWGVLAGELSVEIHWEPDDTWLLRWGARAYLQDAAWFWRRRYLEVQDADTYVTDDKELGPLRAFGSFAGVRARFERFDADLLFELSRRAYPKFDLLPHRHAVVVQLGVTYRP